MPSLITPKNLYALCHSQHPPRLFDASWHLPATARDARAEFVADHLPDAHFFDLTSLCDPHADLPNTVLTDAAAASVALSALGITAEDTIVLYDNSELHSACRAYWLLRLFGHDIEKIYILDGGLSSWRSEGYSVISGAIMPPKSTHYTAVLQLDALIDLAQVKANQLTHAAQHVDLRHAVRFAGGTEHRLDLRRGHIPNSFSFPYQGFFTNEGKFFPAAILCKRLRDIGLELERPIITSCGSGMTACILNFFLDSQGITSNQLYDGSWAEWGADACYLGEHNVADERPVVTSLM